MKIDVINNGYIELVEHWGSDERIVEAARMSTDKGFLGWHAESSWHCETCGYDMTVPHNDKNKIVKHEERFNNLVPCPALLTRHRMQYVRGHNGDDKLLRYLYTHKHMTPFEMAGATIEVQAPIFVFREWHRHRTQSYNELSARYTELPDLFYVPSVERINLGRQSVTNKQSSDEGTVLPREWHEMTRIQELIQGAFSDARETYEELLKLGVARELARIVIPVAQISRMRASANLRNWLAFLTLRMDLAAQFEIRQYANALGVILSGVFPHTWQLFAESVTRDGSEHA